jgi:hypothetical protein
VAAAIWAVVVGSIVVLPIVSPWKGAPLRTAPTGSRQVVDINLATSPPGHIDKVIQEWGKLGYDLYDRRQHRSVYVTSRTPMRSDHVELTFVKR